MRPRAVVPSVEMFPARTPTLPPATRTNSYALGDREVLLIEPATPYEEERRAWVEWARGLAARGRRLLALLLTHHHHDHVGGAAFLARELRLPVWAHQATATRVDGFTVDRALRDGEELLLAGSRELRLSVLHTPGHAPGHLCLHAPDRELLICGDMVASEGTILIDPHDGGDMAEYLRQLARLSALRCAVALPAHGEPIDAPKERFDRYIAHRLAREAKAVRALESAGPGGASLEALVPVVYADTPPSLWPLARMSLEAHLLKLAAEGRALRTTAGWSASLP